MATYVREWLRVDLSIGRVMLLLGLYVVFSCLSVLLAAAALAAPAPMKMDEVRRGTLLFKTEREGTYVPAPTVTTDVAMRVNGMVARVEVKQRFLNPTKSWLEGVYVFPLPENASVDRMRLIVGDRVIEANIAERQAARRKYEKARREGRRAGLVEQERPNIFTTSVANIGPREAVSVEIRYHQTLRYDQGRFRLRFPMVVGPRFIPGPVTTVSADGGGSGWATTANPVPDAERITPPVPHPEVGKINPVTLKIRLDAGFPLTELKSSNHPIKTDDWKDGVAEIELAAGPVPADRDFELVWKPEVGHAPLAGVFRETVDGETYLMVMVLPPDLSKGESAVPARDVVYVLDRSGSMGGASIRQAKRAMRLALERLRATDRFNLIWFNNRTDALFGGVRGASTANIARALANVNSIEANGGTMMLPALRSALRGRAAGKRLRQIVFMTDGAVGNEVQLFREIERRLGKTRLFTVGIGSAPNSYFMRKAAEAGRGTFIHIGRLSEVESRMSDLFTKLERPAVTGIQTAWSAGSVPMTRANGGVEAFPRVAPDLYDGEPLVLTARLPVDKLPEQGMALQLSGVARSRQWRREMNLGGAREAVGIASLWGRSKIAALTDSLREGADRDEVRKAVIETALRHSLVSKYTSLVAVDTTPARPETAKLVSAKAPINLPHGWDYEKVFGKILKRAHKPAPKKLDQRGATPAGPEKVKLAMMNRAQASASGSGAMMTMMQPPIAPTTVGGAPVTLPQGATASGLHLLVGAMSLLFSVGLFLIVFARRRQCA